MTLLEEIVTGASGDAPLATLLRQLKVLAARTDASSLEDWVTHELAGYPDATEVPAYRGPFPLVPLAHFVGGSGREVRNVQLHPSSFPKDLRDGTLFNLWLTQPVAELQHLAESGETIMMTWPADGEVLFHLLHREGKIAMDLQGMQLAQVRCPVQVHHYIGALDAVRVRVLDLALDIERVAPNAGQADASASDRRRAEAAITYHFHGTTSVAIGGDATQLVVGLPQPGDRDGLLAYLGAAGVPAADLLRLEAALDADETEGPHSKRRYARARAWFGEASTELGTGIASGLFVEAAKAFFGA